MDNIWYKNAVFYHIYPLGLCRAPKENNLSLDPAPNLLELREWIPYLKKLGISAVYLGPVCESETHGYDTIDYQKIDRRLGTSKDIKKLIENFHSEGIRIILDGVFNHTGRMFPPFQDLLQNRDLSKYKDWFVDLDFSGNNCYNDRLRYQDWNGCQNLVKLNLKNNQAREHIFEAIDYWIKEWNIDGLRLDAADVIDYDFFKKLSVFTKNKKRDFFLIGEVIHGDYRKWANSEALHSVTNYEIYKGLYSSFNDRNLFEIAYSLNRQYNRDNGIYRNLNLYNFADNHDVDRLSSILKKYEHQYPLYLLMFTIPGIPSIYYGSEWGQDGFKKPDCDHLLRPGITVDEMIKNRDHELVKTLKKLISLRMENYALRHGNYREINVQSQQLVFLRESESQHILIIINGDENETKVSTDLPWYYSKAEDILNNGECFIINGSRINIPVYRNWGRILELYP